MNKFIFEQPFHKHLWRVQITDEAGPLVMSCWPWFTAKDGSLYPNALRYGGGFQMPIARLIELRDAIDRAIDETISQPRA